MVAENILRLLIVSAIFSTIDIQECLTHPSIVLKFDTLHLWLAEGQEDRENNKLIQTKNLRWFHVSSWSLLLPSTPALFRASGLIGHLLVEASGLHQEDN